MEVIFYELRSDNLLPRGLWKSGRLWFNRLGTGLVAAVLLGLHSVTFVDRNY